jgi:hypothetical protein
MDVEAEADADAARVIADVLAMAGHVGATTARTAALREQVAAALASQQRAHDVAVSDFAAASATARASSRALTPAHAPPPLPAAAVAVVDVTGGLGKRRAPDEA